MFLKPFVVTALAKYVAVDLNVVRELMGTSASKYTSTRSRFFSMLFDSVYRDEHELKQWVSRLNKKYSEAWWEPGSRGFPGVKTSFPLWTVGVPEMDDNEGDFHEHFWSDLIRLVTFTLVELLESSAMGTAVAIQDLFDVTVAPASVGLENVAISNHDDAYALLRIALEDEIGALPQLNTIDDVLRLRDRRQPDIRRLRQVLNEVETHARRGSPAGLIKARQEIAIAARDLTRGETADKVGQWASVLALPLVVAEPLLGIPSVGSAALSIVGGGATLLAQANKRRSTWIQVVR
jgi:hypothetical protein